MPLALDPFSLWSSLEPQVSPLPPTKAVAFPGSPAEVRAIAGGQKLEICQEEHGKGGVGFLGSLLEMGLQGVLGQVWPPRFYCPLEAAPGRSQPGLCWVWGIRHPFHPPCILCVVMAT